jgi:hypothetical protein
MNAAMGAMRALDDIEQAVRSGNTGRVVGNLPELIQPNSTVGAQHSEQTVVDLLNVAINGTRASDADREAIKREFGHPTSEGAGLSLQNIQRMRTRLQNQVNSLRASDPAVAAAYDANMAQRGQTQQASATPEYFRRQ